MVYVGVSSGWAYTGGYTEQLTYLHYPGYGQI